MIEFIQTIPLDKVGPQEVIMLALIFTIFYMVKVFIKYHKDKGEAFLRFVSMKDQTGKEERGKMYDLIDTTMRDHNVSLNDHNKSLEKLVDNIANISDNQKELAKSVEILGIIVDRKDK